MDLISESTIVNLPDKPDINDIVIYLTAISELNRRHKGDKRLPFLGTERHHKNTEKIRRYLPFLIFSNPKEIFDLLKDVYYETGDYLRLMHVIIEILNTIGKSFYLTPIRVKTVLDSVYLDIKGIMKLIDEHSYVIYQQIAKEGCSLQLIYYFRFIVLYLQCQSHFYMTAQSILESYKYIIDVYNDFFYHENRFEIIGLKKQNQISLRVNVFRLNEVDALIAAQDYVGASDRINKVQKEFENKQKEFKEEEPFMFPNFEILLCTNYLSLLVDEVSNGRFLPEKISTDIYRQEDIEKAIHMGRMLLNEFQSTVKKDILTNELPLSLMYQIVRAEIITGQVYGTKTLENLSSLRIYGKKSGYSLLSEMLEVEIGRILNPEDVHTVDIAQYHIEGMDNLAMRDAVTSLQWIISREIKLMDLNFLETPEIKEANKQRFIQTLILYKDSEATSTHIRNMITVSIPELLPHYCALLFKVRMVYFLSSEIDLYKNASGPIEQKSIIEKATQEGVERIGKIYDPKSSFILELEKYATYHDIGKLSTPSHILKSELKLTPYERSVIDMHSFLGEIIAEIFSDNEKFVIGKHHEAYSQMAKDEAFLVFDDISDEFVAFSHKLFLVTMIRLADITEAVSGKRNYQRDGMPDNINDLDIQERMQIGMERLLNPSFTEENHKRVVDLLKGLSPFELVVLGSYRRWVNSSLYEQIKKNKEGKTNSQTVFVSLIGDKEWWLNVFKDIEPLLEHNMNIAHSIDILKSRILKERHLFDEDSEVEETLFPDGIAEHQRPGIPFST